MNHPPTADTARISEIFSSLQGEGTHAGERHLFIRFEECHIHCRYCDELDKVGQPMTLEAVMSEVRRLEASQGPHAYVSLTGGEPLLYVVFLKSLMPELKREGFRIYLETNGILDAALQEVIGWCDVIAMDMKPASVTGEGDFDAAHRRFLATAVQKETFVKMVLSKAIQISEFEKQIQIVQDIAPRVPVVLQPLSTPELEGHEDGELMDLLLHLQTLAAKKIHEVRVIPRLHRILQLR